MKAVIRPKGGKDIDKVAGTTYFDMVRATLTRSDPKEFLFFNRNATGKPAARAFVNRLKERTVDRDAPIKVKAFRTQLNLYDLMFGLSTRRATYRPLSDSDVRLSGRSPAFRGAYVHLAEACARLVSSGRVGRQEPEAVAAQLWSYVHGCITLELAEHFAEFDDPVGQVLLPMGVNLVVGLGDDRERAQASHEAGARLCDSITRGSEGQASAE